MTKKQKEFIINMTILHGTGKLPFKRMIKFEPRKMGAAGGNGAIGENNTGGGGQGGPGGFIHEEKRAVVITAATAEEAVEKVNEFFSEYLVINEIKQVV